MNKIKIIEDICDECIKEKITAIHGINMIKLLLGGGSIFNSLLSFIIDDVYQNENE